MSWLLALGALAVWQQGLQRRRQESDSGELSAGCKAKKQETHTFQTNTNSYTKEKPYTVIEVLTLPQDRVRRKGEGRSLHEKAQLKKYFPRSYPHFSVNPTDTPAPSLSAPC